MNTRYQTIVADPPWHYESWPKQMTRAKPGSKVWKFVDGFDPTLNRVRTPISYPTMSVPQIAALPVAESAADGCHLYLWTTNRYLRDAFDVLAAWGFRYGQTLIWAKTPMGLGPGGTFAQNAEYILFARRGTLRHLRRANSVWFNWRRMGPGSHSRKPEAFQDMVEQVSPGPYLELFARRRRLGWDAWGDEIESSVSLACARALRKSTAHSVRSSCRSRSQ